ncbi:hypothetical protein HanRHA438_Chr00c05g0845321 [Helianthus annuus]|nr:hypothetical protein HanLR1_Chr07g0252671 [Helianthus annuus]KAJ0905759.1 hypothetical protein HanPSC8_Chr07g0297751 [Helianthus annuus]KAJ0954934.1 hypothetical protein HanRHA438_Chr00c05g0845321 [Helianthus annuus]
MNQQQQQLEDLGFCPSFSCYSSDTQPSATAVAAGRISRQLLQQQQADRFHDDDEFEFSLVIGDDEFSPEDVDNIDSISTGRTVFPLFNRDLLLIDEDCENRKTKLAEEEIDLTTTSLRKLFITEREQSGCSSSSEDESEGDAPAVFCVWRNKNDAGASPLSKCKKSRSTGSGAGSGSGSKRWRIRDLLRRSNSEGKEPMVMFAQKKVEMPKRKLSSGEGLVTAGKLKPSSPSVHEVFYVQQRAKREGVKRRSYLPYRQGLVGFFSNGNGKKA